MKFKVGTYVIIIDPDNTFYPECKLQGRIGKIVSATNSIRSNFILLEFALRLEDNFWGKFIHIPYTFNNLNSSLVIPIDINNNLIRLVCSTQ